MRILAVDTSGKEIGIGIFDGKTCLEERYITAERAYNRHIMPLILKIFEKAGVKPAGIDIFAAVLGPGSFTGIRVGMAVMKAFAQAFGKKFAGASALDIIAASTGARGPVWAAIEAGRSEVYAGRYGRGHAGARAAPKTKYLLLNKEEFIKKLKKGDTLAGVMGDNILIEVKQKCSKINVVEFEHINMKSFAEIITAKKRIERKSLYSIAPVYIRPPEAEARLKLKKTEA